MCPLGQTNQVEVMSGRRHLPAGIRVTNRACWTSVARERIVKLRSRENGPCYFFRLRTFPISGANSPIQLMPIPTNTWVMTA